MSSCDGLRRARLAGLGVTLGIVLGACGFQPLYGQASGSSIATVDDLARVQITPLGERTGQQLHNLLRDRINPRGQPAQPAYVLTVTLDENIRELGVEIDETATRSNLSLRANFELRLAATGERLTNGNSVSINSYNILSNEFATFSAEQDPRERGLREIADDIKVRLAIFFQRARRAQSS